MKFRDYYQILGVARGAEPDAIKHAYRRLARKFHPDVSAERDAEERFKEVQEAYEVLKDPDKRAAYDRFGSRWKAGQEFRPPPDWEREFGVGGGFTGGGFTGSGDFSDFFEALFGRTAGRRRAGARRTPAKGEDVHSRLTISLEDAFRGTVRAITVNVTEPAARGQPTLKPRTLNVSVPKGIIAGRRVRLAGQGGAGVGGAPRGDLFLTVEFAPHPLYTAAGRDVYGTLPVAPWEAALGRTVEVPTLGGKVDLRIPAGSQTGQRLRLKGRGLPGNPAGDHYVTLEVMLPRADTPQARAFYERMEREMPFEPRAKLGS